MDKYGKKFCKSLKAYFDRKYGDRRGAIKEFSDLIGFSYSQTANMLRCEKGSTEEKRRHIAEKIGLSYEEMIGVVQPSINNNITVELENIKSSSSEPIQKDVLSDSIGDLMDMTQKILESGSHWSFSLASDIKSFYKGLVSDHSDRRKSDQPDKIPMSGDRRKAVG